jgi:hypothetical protein
MSFWNGLSRYAVREYTQRGLASSRLFLGRNDRPPLPRRLVDPKRQRPFPDAIEAPLAHVEGNAVRRAYAGGTLRRAYENDAMVGGSAGRIQRP